MFSLPSPSHKARELFDMESIVEILNPARAGELLTTMEARKSAERMFAADTTKAMKRICFVVLRGDSDERWLISVGRRGGWRKEWNFGNGREVLA